MPHDIEYQIITSLDEVDLDSLFDASFVHLNKNTTWPVEVPDYLKKNLYLRDLKSAVAGGNQYQIPNDTLFMYVIKVDGVVCEFAAGYLQKNKSLRIHWLLNKPVNDSRHWRYTSENREAHKAFLKQNNIVTYRMVTFIGASIYAFMKNRAKAGFYKITDEKLVSVLPNGTQIVILTIDPF